LFYKKPNLSCSLDNPNKRLNDLSRELCYFEDALHGDYFAGNISVADFTIVR